MGVRWQSVPAALCCLWAAGAAPAPRQVELAGRDVRVADLAVMRANDAARFGNLVVARVPEGHAAIALSPARQKILLRWRVPGGSFALRHNGETIFRAKPDVARTRAEGTCVELNAPLASGEYLDRPAVSVTPCRADAPAAALTFDRRLHALRAITPIAAGTYLGRLFVATGEVARIDRTYNLVFRSGPVAVERKVQLVRPARVGQAALVRTEDGAVLRAPLAGVETARNAP